MYTNLKNKIHNIDPFDIVFGAMLVAGIVVTGALAADAIKADRLETKHAIENGRRVVSLFGQKVIF